MNTPTDADRQWADTKRTVTRLLHAAGQSLKSADDDARTAWEKDDPAWHDWARERQQKALSDHELATAAANLYVTMEALEQRIAADKITERQTRQMIRSSWVLTFSTVVLALATVGLIWATLAA